jgi:hypothetical protein
VMKGAPAALPTLAPFDPAARAELESLSQSGYCTLAVAAGPPGQIAVLGLVALPLPPSPTHRGSHLFDFRSEGTVP